MHVDIFADISLCCQATERGDPEEAGKAGFDAEEEARSSSRESGWGQLTETASPQTAKSPDTSHAPATRCRSAKDNMQ